MPWLSSRRSSTFPVLPSPSSRSGPESRSARIYQCLFSNGGGHLEEAREILEDVIADISDETRLVDLTADAHFSLGIYHLLKEDQGRAIAEFETAVETTRNDLRKRGFYFSMAFIYECQLDQPELAEAYYAGGRIAARPSTRSDPMHDVVTVA